MRWANQEDVGGTDSILIIYDPKSAVCKRNVSKQSIRIVDLKQKDIIRSIIIIIIIIIIYHSVPNFQKLSVITRVQLLTNMSK
jgi:hypothetical protein